MAAINFPDSPSNGDTHTVGGVTYTYNSTETKWKTTINSNAFLPLSGGTVSGNILMGGEIQHDGDTDTNIAFDTDTILFDTAGSERFRVGSAGQLGIGGATYGSSGQVLTSGGASAAPSWATSTDTFGLTHLTSVSTSSQSSVTITGIPSTATMVYINIYNVGSTVNGGSRLDMRVGNGSVDSGANRYKWNSGWITYNNGSGSGSSSGDTKFNLFNPTISGTGHRNMGTIQLLRTGDSGWVLTSFCGDTDSSAYTLYCSGMYTEHTAIDRVHLYNANGDNFTNSSLFMVSYQ